MFSSRRFLMYETSLLVKQVPFRRVFSVSSNSIIQLGDPLPQAELYEDYPTNIIRMPDLVVGRNIVLFGVTGAFTPGCSKTHLPGYLKLARQMKEDGIDEIICVSVNDPYVMSAWGAKYGAKGKIRLLADPSGTFVSALGLGTFLPSLGGLRSKRFSMFVSKNQIKEINVEPTDTGLSCSLATRLFYKNHLKPNENEKL